MTPHTNTTAHDNAQNRHLFRTVTWRGLWANIALSVVKICVGWFGRSHALVADGIHSASDTFSDIALLAGHSWWNKPADDTHPYGHRQLETIVTIGIGVLLLFAAVGIVISAMTRIREGAFIQPSYATFIVALLSLCVKEWLYRWTYAVGARLHSAPLMANAWHHRSDALSSIPVALALGMTLMGARWAYLDACAAIIVAGFLLHAAIRIAWPACHKLLGGGVSTAMAKAIHTSVMSHPQVKEAHKLRARYLGCAWVAIDIHVLVDGALSVDEGHSIAEDVKALLRERHPEIVDVVVHIEPADGAGAL